jgi:hypothetical protein
MVTISLSTTLKSPTIVVYSTSRLFIRSVLPTRRTEHYLLVIWSCEAMEQPQFTRLQLDALRLAIGWGIEIETRKLQMLHAERPDHFVLSKPSKSANVC